LTPANRILADSGMGIIDLEKILSFSLKVEEVD
jgi:hypothetical protein